MLMKTLNDIRKRILCISAAGLLAAAMLSQTVAAAPETGAEAADTKEGAVSGEQKESKELPTDLASLAEKQADLDAELATLMSDIKKADKEKKKCRKELKSAQADVDAQYDSMKGRIRYMYEEGDVSMMNMLFGAKSMADFVNKADYVSTISEYDRKMLSELEASRKVVEDKRDKLNAKLKKLRSLKKERIAKQKELARAIEKAIAKMAAQAGVALPTSGGSGSGSSTPAFKLPDPGQPITINTGNGSYTWNGSVLTRAAGVNKGPSGMETYYNLNMSGVVSIMRSMGNKDKYWVRSDGVKMLGDYVMVGADFRKHPRGSIVETSLGKGIVCDTGYFKYKKQFDIATAW